MKIQGVVHKSYFVVKFFVLKVFKSNSDKNHKYLVLSEHVKPNFAQDQFSLTMAFS